MQHAASIATVERNLCKKMAFMNLEINNFAVRSPVDLSSFLQCVNSTNLACVCRYLVGIIFLAKMKMPSLNSRNKHQQGLIQAQPALNNGFCPPYIFLLYLRWRTL